MSRLIPGLASLFILLATLLEPASAAVVKVPSGNRNATQPDIPSASYRRTRQLRSTFEGKYRKIRDLLANDSELRAKIRKAANDYHIDPMHIVGALVGEHTYNVDAMDQLQTYYVKALSYLRSNLEFAYKGESVVSFVSRPQFARCDRLFGSEAIWSCREAVYEADFRGKTVDGNSYPDNRFGAVFFQPYYAGQTFGLGQLNPLTALAASDEVHRVSGYPELSANDAPEVYAAIMNPDKTLAYVAAVLKMAIDDYRTIADFDISGNPGITATLYNIGDPRRRAEDLAAENARRRARGQSLRLPQENYYGWLVNDRLDDLKAAFGEN
ncbi:DUF1402 family protein [Consotaella salsifontis]|uniref:DUF1402 family protein n=1 Tax=Consotaella salsifontis TaxID=1365950 RepID=A0A1T4T4H5_9HYPH|nr:DUF1402 family protein [Consotaella salsifontis]SKA35420.1 Protein of unknown function [Consotaella salsifontis]